MLTSQAQLQLRKMMVFEEDKKNFIYEDHLGNQTVGIGHLCANGFSDAVVELIFQEDWQPCEVWLLRTFAWFDQLDLVRQLALINFRFQLGPDRFLKFKATIDCLSKKDFIGASRQMLASKWAKQTPNRATRVAYMILHGEFPKEYKL